MYAISSWLSWISPDLSYYASRNRDSTSAPREFLVFPFNSLDLFSGPFP